MSSLVRLTLACLSACALALTVGVARPAPALAAPEQVSIMMDDDLMVYRSDKTRDEALKGMKSLGVDVVRVTLLWSVVAERARDTKAKDKRFRRLGADDPRAYGAAIWDRYDRLVRTARTLGIQVYFNVTGPGPAYAHAKPPKQFKKDAKWWKPKPAEFAKFVTAVGRRFDGTYRDENDGRRRLGRVSFWSLWNEPNQGGWLRPQYEGGKPASPAIFRALYRAGYRALVATDHEEDTILLGETAPRSVERKTTTSAMGVRTFARELLCAPGTSKRGCSSFAGQGPLKATAWAHHPYTRELAPTQAEPDPESITLANLNDLPTLLDDLARQTGNLAAGLPIMSTEFGYETEPPDPFFGVTEQQQADYLATAELLTFLNPRVLGHTQFLLRDSPPVKGKKVGSRAYWGTYQSGLFTLRGAPKPAVAAYAFPFIAQGAGVNPETGQPQAGVFGQIRFRDNPNAAASPDTVQLEHRPADGSTDFVPVGQPVSVTSAKGYFFAQVPIPGPGQLRAVWTGQVAPGRAVSVSRPVG